MNVQKKIDVMDELLYLTKKSKLNDTQRAKFLNIVENLNTATEIQRERFIIYYNLSDKNKIPSGNYTIIARAYGCTSNAIINSVRSVRNRLIRMEEGFEELEKIVEECRNNIC